MNTEPDLLDIEPDPEPALRLTLAVEEPVAESTAQPTTIEKFEPSLMRVLPTDFPLMPLLQFLPDVKLKQRADHSAEVALSIDVAVPGGLARADAALDDLRAVTTEIETCFEFPCSVANRLHKRLTGLRADFLKEASGAIAVLSRRLVEEKRRRDREAEAERRRMQEEADRHAREAAQKAAEEARRQQAPVGVQQILEQQAKTATAPPIVLPDTETLRATAITSKWRARLVGTTDDAPANPDVDEMTDAQRLSVLTLLRAIVEGRAPIIAIEINWSYLNKRAEAEKSALSLPGVEAIDEGGTRKRK